MMHLYYSTELWQRELSADETERYLASLPHRVYFRRSREHILQEYNTNKYGRLLAQDLITPDDARRAELKGLTGSIVVSRDNRLFYMDALNACLQQDQMLVDILKHYKADCELGCGYGYFLHKLQPAKVCGGELTENGVLLARRFGLNVVPFDFYQAEDYEFIRPGSTVFTSHSVEQLPSAVALVENLRLRGVAMVINFEPCPPTKATDALGKARMAYTEQNDYNRDLEPLLLGTRDVQILNIEHDIMGLRPSNPTNLYIWRFR